MYGKHFDSMYCGSMVGKGFGAFSMMGYVISTMKPDKEVGFQVELNTTLLATIFGEPEDKIQKTIDFLCDEDPESRSPAEEGRRLVKIGTYAYRVVNGVAYDKIRNEADRREQNRIAQQKHRAKLKGGQPDGGARLIAAAEDRAAQAPVSRPENDGRD